MFSYSAIMEIQTCMLEDSGDYKIVVKNKEGQCQCIAKVEVTKSIIDSKVPKLNLVGLIDGAPLPRGKGSGTNTPRTPTSATRRYLERVRGRDSRSNSLKDDFRRTRSFESSFNGPFPTFPGPSIKASSLNSILLSRSLSSSNDGNANNNDVQMETSSIATSTATMRQNLYRRSRQSDDTQSWSVDQEYPDSVSDIVTQSTASTSGVFMMEDSIESRRSSISGRHKTPIILKPLKEIVTMPRGQKLTLSCTVTGRPRPHPVWLKNAEVIQESSGVLFQKSGSRDTGYIFNLTINNPTPFDSGIYTFSALNVAGDTSSTSKVSVLSLEGKIFSCKPHCMFSTFFCYRESDT